jgi:ArsR family transcriptional regulator
MPTAGAKPWRHGGGAAIAAGLDIHRYLAKLPNMKARSLTRARKAKLEARARIIKALAHPARLLIVEELQAGERCVCELQALIGSEMSTVSKHLSILHQAGLVTTDKRGTSVYYSLQVPCVLGFLKCVEGVMQANAARHRELV